MKMQMTDRDKKLLIFLAVFVIIVGIGYWGIYPQIKAIIKINDDIEIEQTKQILDDTKLASLPMLKVENERLEEDIVDARNHFYKMMTSDEVDKYMTGMALEHNLHAQSLSIFMPDNEAELQAYMYSKKFRDDKDQEELESDEEESDNGGRLTEKEQLALLEPEEIEVSSEGLVGIYDIGISMELSGETEDLQKFIDDIFESKEKIWLRTYDWTYSRYLVQNTETGDYEEKYSPSLQVSLNIYMCEE